MCGRYVLYSDNEFEELKEIVAETEKEINLKVGEVFPTNTVPVVVENRIQLLKWGFYTYDKKLIINARSETVESKPMFKNAFYGKRCLIPATSYFEWKKESSGKTKYEISPANRSLFFMAGLYNTFRDNNNNVFDGFVIITTPANKTTSEIHSRMPAILERGEEKLWLDKNITDTTLLKQILKPYSDESILCQVAQPSGSIETPPLFDHLTS